MDSAKSRKPAEGYSLLEAAKTFGVSRAQLILLLKQNGLLGPNNLPFREQIRDGLIKIKTSQYQLPGWNISRWSARANITGQGMAIIGMLLDEQRQGTQATRNRDSSVANQRTAQPRTGKGAETPASAG